MPKCLNPSENSTRPWWRYHGLNSPKNLFSQLCVCVWRGEKAWLGAANSLPGAPFSPLSKDRFLHGTFSLQERNKFFVFCYDLIFILNLFIYSSLLFWAYFYLLIWRYPCISLSLTTSQNSQLGHTAVEDDMRGRVEMRLNTDIGQVAGSYVC